MRRELRALTRIGRASRKGRGGRRGRVRHHEFRLVSDCGARSIRLHQALSNQKGLGGPHPPAIRRDRL